MFDNAESVTINNKAVKSIITTNGGVIWEKEEPTVDYLTITVNGNSQSFGASPIFVGDTITVDWGDGTTETVSTLQGKSHSYSDGLYEHTITLIGEVTELPSGCFYNINLTGIYIPSSVTTFGDGLFSNKLLQSISFSENCQLTQFSNGCFATCIPLTSITIPSSITSIGHSCFGGCSGLTSIIIPNSVINIGEYCFGDCTALTSINIPNGVTTLGSQCFRRAGALTSVSIPSSVTNIGSMCFIGCNVEDYQLHWEDSDILTYYSQILTTGTNTVFTIPNGQTANYIAKGYPSNKLVERSD